MGTVYAFAFLLVATTPLVTRKFTEVWAVATTSLTATMVVDLAMHLFAPVSPNIAKVRMTASFVIAAVALACLGWSIFSVMTECEDSLQLWDFPGRINLSVEEQRRLCVQIFEPYQVAAMTLASLGVLVYPLPYLFLVVLHFVLCFVAGRQVATGPFSHEQPGEIAVEAIMFVVCELGGFAITYRLDNAIGTPPCQISHRVCQWSKTIFGGCANLVCQWCANSAARCANFSKDNSHRIFISPLGCANGVPIPFISVPITFSGVPMLLRAGMPKSYVSARRAAPFHVEAAQRQFVAAGNHPRVGLQRANAVAMAAAEVVAAAAPPPAAVAVAAPPPAVPAADAGAAVGPRPPYDPHARRGPRNPYNDYSQSKATYLRLSDKCPPIQAGPPGYRTRAEFVNNLLGLDPACTLKWETLRNWMKARDAKQKAEALATKCVVESAGGLTFYGQEIRDALFFASKLSVGIPSHRAAQTCAAERIASFNEAMDGVAGPRLPFPTLGDVRAVLNKEHFRLMKRPKAQLSREERAMRRAAHLEEFRYIREVFPDIPPGNIMFFDETSIPLFLENGQHYVPERGIIDGDEPPPASTSRARGYTTGTAVHNGKGDLLGMWMVWKGQTSRVHVGSRQLIHQQHNPTKHWQSATTLKELYTQLLDAREDPSKRMIVVSDSAPVHVGRPFQSILESPYFMDVINLVIPPSITGDVQLADRCFFDALKASFTSTLYNKLYHEELELVNARQRLVIGFARLKQLVVEALSDSCVRLSRGGQKRRIEDDLEAVYRLGPRPGPIGVPMAGINRIALYHPRRIAFRFFPYGIPCLGLPALPTPSQMRALKAALNKERGEIDRDDTETYSLMVGLPVYLAVKQLRMVQASFRGRAAVDPADLVTPPAPLPTLPKDRKRGRDAPPDEHAVDVNAARAVGDDPDWEDQTVVDRVASVWAREHGPAYVAARFGSRYAKFKFTPGTLPPLFDLIDAIEREAAGNDLAAVQEGDADADFEADAGDPFERDFGFESDEDDDDIGVA